MQKLKNILPEYINGLKNIVKNERDHFSALAQNKFAKNRDDWDYSPVQFLDEKIDASERRIQKLTSTTISYACRDWSKIDFLVDTNNAFTDISPIMQNSSKAFIVGRNDDVSYNLFTFQRNPYKIKLIFDEAYHLLDGSGSNLESLTEGSQALSGAASDEISHRTELATKLWGDKISNNYIDLFGMIDEKQINILKESSQGISFWIQGLAGTGKTVIANEIAGKFAAADKRTYALYSNDRVKKSAIDFYEIVNKTKHIQCFTYDEMQEKIISNINEYFSNNSKNKIYKNISNERIYNVGNSKVKTNIPPFDIIELFSNSYTHGSNEYLFIYKSMLKMSERFVNRKLLGDDKEFREFFYLMKKEVAKLKLWFKNKTQTSELDFNSVLNFLLPVPDCVILDEAPILLKYPILLHQFNIKSRGYIKTYISSFDEFQYSQSENRDIWKYAHYDRKKVLNEVFRTTSEIFGLSANFLEKYSNKKINFDSYISLSDSLTFTESPIYDDVIYISDVISNPEKYIGSEFRELSVVVDKKISVNNFHLAYIAFTRAVASLNIIDRAGVFND